MKTATRFLVICLLLPLALLALLAMWSSYHFNEPWRGLLVNLAAAFVGSILTVFFVDSVIRRQERQRWAAVQSRISRRLFRLANVAISSVRTALEIPIDLDQIDPTLPGAQFAVRDRIIELGENVLPPLLPGISKIDQKHWKTLSQNMQNVSSYVDRILSTFGRGLNPIVTQLILDIQSAADGVVVAYTTFPDLLGLESHELPRRRDGSSSEPLQHAWCAVAIDHMGRLLTLSVRLHRQLDDLPPLRG